MSPSIEVGKKRRGRASGIGSACAGVVACAAVLAPIQVPREISERTALELSGITWSHTLSRYVTVSDDVTDRGAKHAPLLFALSADGRLDPAPIRIEGLSELNDPEAIAEGPAGTLFVCTSHSINAHGHLPESRRQLLHLAVGQDRTAKILGRLDLTLAKDASGAPPWGPGRLDVEGLAFHDGALYFGLKSPLAADGSASIFRLPDAVAALKAGAVPPGAIVRWRSARLCLPSTGASVCEGVADLAFLPDGALLVVANSPKGMPSDGGGALWKLPAGGDAPALLRHFEGEKPEGVALAPDGKAAVIVFDRDGRNPAWLTWRLGE